jgi:hypothetical protein
MFPHCVLHLHLFAAYQRLHNQWVLPNLAYLRKERFELVANPGKVVIDGLRLDVGGHKDSEKAEGVGGGFCGEIVECAEVEIR